MTSRTRHTNGFTLIELLIVVIIISIVFTIALPFYRTAKESSVGSKAMENLNTIRTAQLSYRADRGTFSTDIPTLQGYATFTQNDGDWAYTILSADESTFSAAATRTAPGTPYDGLIITIDESSTLVFPGGGDRYSP